MFKTSHLKQHQRLFYLALPMISSNISPLAWLSRHGNIAHPEHANYLAASTLAAMLIPQ
ncbi:MULTISPECIES: hypothetical protein [Colwellia]|uniref:hypothetical protein n=1 Tax=Colwellia TaxID=28228 RepID=UPI000AC63A28|nr:MULTISPECIES: hypothetical protein [Colwellia]